MNPSVASERQYEINRAIRMSMTGLSFCILFDGLVVVIEICIDGIAVPSFCITSDYDLSLLINAIALVCTYDKWYDILFGFYH